MSKIGLIACKRFDRLIDNTINRKIKAEERHKRTVWALNEILKKNRKLLKMGLNSLTKKEKKEYEQYMSLR